MNKRNRLKITSANLQKANENYSLAEEKFAKAERVFAEAKQGKTDAYAHATEFYARRLRQQQEIFHNVVDKYNLGRQVTVKPNDYRWAGSRKWHEKNTLAITSINDVYVGFTITTGTNQHAPDQGLVPIEILHISNRAFAAEVRRACQAETRALRDKDRTTLLASLEKERKSIEKLIAREESKLQALREKEARVK